MKRTITILIVLMMTAGAAFAQVGPTTATLLLQGEVAARVSIAVEAEDVAESLDLATDQDDLMVATVTEISNVRAGYTVTLSSANEGRLVGLNANTAGTSDTGDVENVPYTIGYNGADHDLAAGTATITDVSARNVQGNNVTTVPVLLSYTGDPDLGADTYQDTLTFTIIAK